METPKLLPLDFLKDTNKMEIKGDFVRVEFNDNPAPLVTVWMPDDLVYYLHTNKHLGEYSGGYAQVMERGKRPKALDIRAEPPKEEPPKERCVVCGSDLINQLFQVVYGGKKVCRHCGRKIFG